MKNKFKTVTKILGILTACLMLASFSPSLDGRALVVDQGVFPQGLFAKTVGYLPGDIISVANIAGDSTVDLLVIGALDPSDGIAIMLSPEAAEALGISKNDNNIVKITKRDGQNERVYGTAVIAKNNAEPEPALDYEIAEEDFNETEEDAFSEETFEENENEIFDEEELESETEAEAEPEPEAEAESSEEPALEEMEEEAFEEETVVPEESAEEEPELESEDTFETIEAAESEPEEESEDFEDEEVAEQFEEEAFEEEEALPEEPLPEESEEALPPEEESPLEEEYEEEAVEESIPEPETEEEAVPAPEAEPEAEVEAEPVEEAVEEEEEVEEELVTEYVPEEKWEVVIPDDVWGEEEYAEKPVTPDMSDEVPAENPYEEEDVLEEVTGAAVARYEEALEDDSDDVEAMEESDDTEYDEYAAIVLVPVEPESAPAPVEESEEEAEEEPEVPAVSPAPAPVIAAPEPAPAPAPAADESESYEMTDNDYSKYMVDGLSDLKSSAYYIQIATLSVDENIMEIVNKYSGNYPITIVPLASGARKQVLIGPVSMDEYAVVLARFKAYGYKDAFLRKIK